MSALPVHVESEAARPYGRGSRTTDGRMYVGALIDRDVFHRLWCEIARRGLDLDAGLERALVEGWLAPETLVVERPTKGRRVLPAGGRASP